MDKIVFLDRDGTINQEVEYLHRPEDLVILPGVAEALCRLKNHGFKLVVVTNQAGVARGYYQEEDVKALHQVLNERLAEQGAAIDCFFYCPHHPVHGIGSYKIKCHCRKPETGMFEMAEAYFSVDKTHSFMIGDKLLDTQAGKNYGVTPILIGTGYGQEVCEGMSATEKTRAFDFYAKTMKEAADYIISREEKPNGTNELSG
ncbi:D-glycero-beta-D-manno-heptose 1,7-bisphosphate 7-phosphatase [Clostridium sp. HBUAS56010]|uniref:D-glycero-beta-D-manno-heptose 1,7-bisphosphate 7-phosphatase n=1 Tax=Clostridium sp. HBUAS56010 TaxID=2571127 RepID=UPI0011780A93|nr:D-glycero-beta-D-manno-heptose 1,7-bisphosphate 7-phosphatase [Clostridium sp. HBUAS56010]